MSNLNPEQQSRLESILNKYNRRCSHVGIYSDDFKDVMNELRNDLDKYTNQQALLLAMFEHLVHEG